MILKALCDYYERNKDKLPPFGLELKEIGFLIVISRDGKFIRFEDRRIDKKQAQAFLVKKQVGRTSAPIANFLYDNCAYVLGYNNKDGDDRKILNCFNLFKEKVLDALAKEPENEDLKALSLFYKQSPEEIHAQIKTDPLWDDIVKNLNKKYSNFSFLIEGDTTIVASKQELISLSVENGQNDKIMRCIVSGESMPIVETTTATMIRDSQATAKLVSFQVGSGYDSYGKQKGFNAPIGDKTNFYYTTALNSMLASDSRNKFHIGNRTFVFWASSADESSRTVEDGIFSLFGFTDSDSNVSVEEVRKVFKSIYSGDLKTQLDDRFYILGLAPNSARIAVSYWADIQLKEFAGQILRHFDDMEVISKQGNNPLYGLFALMAATTATGKSSDASPNLAEQLVKSIFEGTPYPFGLFVGVLNRIRAGKNHVSPTQAGIIKAYLNRLRNNNNKKLEPMLDKENNNRGYLCGRLFAVLVKMQEEANNISTVRERYMSSASSTPAAVFSTILNLSSHHAEKLNPGRQVFFEKLKQEIIDKLDADGFPAHLDLQDQGRFFVGYYHQRQDFFQSREETAVDEN